MAPTRSYRFVQLDVFTDRPFTGNPLAVFPEAVGLSGEEMQLIAREMNLSETTFVLPSRDPKAAYRMRVFTPFEELPYAGHPSVGTAFLLATEGRLKLSPPRTRFHQDVEAGVLALDVESDDAGRVTRVFTTQATPVFERPVEERTQLAAALGVDTDDLLPTLPVQVVSTGVRWLMVPMRSVDAVARVQPSVAAFEPLRARVGTHFVYPFALDARHPDASTHARGIILGEFEDPFTGSASGCLGAYLAKHRAVEARDGVVAFMHEQGEEVKRPGLASVEVEVDAAGEPTVVRVGGPAVKVLEGALTMP